MPLRLAILGATVAAASAAAADAPANCSDPSPCADFCSGRCSFSPTPATEMELIRMTPRGVLGIAGDLFFTLLNATKVSECSKPTPAPWAGCFLA